MNFNPFKLKTNSLIFIIAILLMVSFYFFYFEVYVKNNEARIVKADFRKLNQIGLNIDDKVRTYVHNALNFSEYISGLLHDKESIDIDSLRSIINKLNKSNTFNKDLKIVQITDTAGAKRITAEYEKKSNFRSFIFPVKNERSPSGSNTVIFKISYKDILKGLERKDIFDGLILIRDSNIVYNNIGEQLLLLPHELKQIDNENTTEGRSSSLPPGDILSGKLSDIQISNIDYKAFFKPFTINNETWYAVGLINKAKFNASIRSIEPWIIITLSMFLIFIILGLPVIKLMVLSKTEQLDTRNIIDYALFVMLGGAFLTVFASFLSQNYINKHTTDQKLTALSDTIYGSFLKELNAAYDQISHYDLVYSDIFCTKDTDRIIQNILDNKDSVYYPSKYPFGDYYYWTDSNGMQTAYLTPFNKKIKLTNLSTRDYINKKDEWFFPGTDNKKFRLQSIVSVNSGIMKAGIAKKGINDERPVVAMSTRMYSIINTILPMNYSYCIIDRKGKVWFHSNPQLNLRENFLEESGNNKYLQAALYANLTKALNLTYDNDQYRIHIRPIDKLPLYLIVMYNKKAVKSFQAETITASLLIVGLSFLIIFLQILALLTFEKIFRQKFHRNLLIKLTRPIPRLEEKYKYLIVISILLSISTFIFLSYYKDSTAITAVMSLTIIFFTRSYRLLNNNTTKKNHRKAFSCFNHILFCIVTITGIIFSPADWWKILLFDIVTCLIVRIGFKTLKKPIELLDKLLTDYWSTYTLLLLSIFVLMGIIPSLHAYETGFNNESAIRVKHKLTDLMYKKEHHNELIRSFYDNINPSSSRNNIIKQRRDLGIYIKFDNSAHFHSSAYALPDKPTNRLWDTMYCYIRPFYDKYTVKNKYLPYRNTSNENRIWHEGTDSITLEYSSLTKDICKNTAGHRYITSFVPRIRLYNPLYRPDKGLVSNIIANGIFWFLVVLIVLIFYFLLKFGIYRIFNHNIIKNYYYQDFGTILNHLIDVHNCVIVIRQSPADKSNVFYKEFIKTKSKNRNIKLVDWSKNKGIKYTEDLFLNPFKHKNKIILIKEFDHNYTDHKLMEQKLSVITKMLSLNNLKVIITSQYTLKHIVEFYQKQIEKIPESERTKEPALSYTKIANRLNCFNKTYIATFMPLCYRLPDDIEKDYKDHEPIVPDKDQILNIELKTSDYLHQFTDTLKIFKEEKDNKSNDYPDEVLINKVLSLAEKYYEDIFNNCTPEEQYILIDLAHDLIINPKNEKAILSLLKKGILVKKHFKVVMMNKSFLKFAVSKLSLAKELEAKLVKGQDSGTWHGYKLTLTLIIMSLFVFIAMANHNFLDNLNQVFIAIGGGIAVITSLIGLLSRKSKHSDN